MTDVNTDERGYSSDEYKIIEAKAATLGLTFTKSDANEDSYKNMSNKHVETLIEALNIEMMQKFYPDYSEDKILDMYDMEAFPFGHAHKYFFKVMDAIELDGFRLVADSETAQQDLGNTVPSPEFIAQLKQSQENSVIKPGEPSYGHLFNDDLSKVELVKSENKPNKRSFGVLALVSFVISIASMIAFNNASEMRDYTISGTFILLSSFAVGVFITKFFQSKKDTKQGVNR